ncbi:MAG: TrpR-like protein, YerC/YecD [Oscillospiraceae bacterium]|nr:TrpR-like protein, YerC/YecD [Oscillospiraceae bacterium]
MEQDLNRDSLDYLYESILTLKTPGECAAFLSDLCTVQELKAISQRMQVAKMLSDRVIYDEIRAQTGASTATISRVNRCLLYGSNGYKTVLERLEG